MRISVKKMIVKVKVTALLLAFSSLFGTGINEAPLRSSEKKAIEEADWVESTFNSMSLEEQIGQLFMIRAHSDLGEDHISKVEELIKKYHVGSLCFFQGTPERQAELTNHYQKISKTPLLIAIDAEWGLGMRMKNSAISFPRQLMLGAIQDNRLIYEMGAEVARQLKRVGIHFNFAPVVDVNNNAANPVINTRSFGEDRYNVAAKSFMYMKGMQDHGILASAKHFPGHGDTDVDSHFELPVISHDKSRLDSIELFPFKILVQHGIESVMVAHLNVPAIDSTNLLPTTLSKKTVTGLLKNEIGFNGLIVTDALEMKAVTKHFKNGEVEARALYAGNDILLLPQDVEAAVNRIKSYLLEGIISPEQIEKSVKKILQAKYRLGLQNYSPVEMHNIRADLNNPAANVLKRKLIANALTLVRNEKNLIPFRDLEYRKFASLSIGSKSKTPFQNTLDKYTRFSHYNIEKDFSTVSGDQLLEQLRRFDVVVVGLHDMSSFASKDFGLTTRVKELISALHKTTQVVLTVFGSPYSLKYFDELSWVIEAYEEDEDTQDLAAQALFGAFGFGGRLPVSASPKSRFNTGIATPGLLRLGYDLPENVGLDANVLSKIDTIANEAINIKATPGCVVLVAKNGKVVFNKAYGYHTYKRQQPVQTDDIYDLASVTKIAASTISIMRLHEQGLININQPLSNYLPELKNSNKSSMIIEDMMAHRAGLEGWIKFYEQTLSGSKTNPRPSSKFYKNRPSESFRVPVADNLFLSNDFVPKIWQQIIDSELSTSRNYKYSDLGFYLISALVNKVTGIPLDQFVQKEFYKPLGLSTAAFNPLQQFPKTRIPPTEEDKYFRRRRIHGYVHDMGAAMLGGVSGHAGLFSDANDIAIIMQMLLNNGFYGGKQYFKPETVQLFTTRFTGDTRRGIGFDMKETNPRRSQNMSPLATSSTFGHLGFTGICAWADPENDIIYIFLSNRTYPSMYNNKLGKEDIRPRIQSVIYEAITY